MLQALKKLDWILMGAIILLVAIGLLSVASASQARIGDFSSFKKQLIFFIIGLALLLIFSFIDYRFLRNYSTVVLALYILSVCLLVALLLLGNRVRGSVSWFQIGSPIGELGIEPVEAMKFILIIVLAKYFSGRHIDFGLVRHVFVSGFYALLPVGLVLLQPDLGSAVLMVTIWVGIMLVSGIRARHLLVLFLIFAIIAGLSWFFLFKEYQRARVLTFLQPQSDPLGQGYNVLQSIIAIGSGGFWGKGLGHGSQSQLNFLPEQHTDFIWATIAEEWGFFGVFFVLGLFGIIFWRLFLIAVNANTNFARLFIFGLSLLLLTHITINIGMNMGFFPVTGISLPLLSYGGSNLIATMLAFGIAQNIKYNL
ncbi:MAG: Rod shape-determining protein RodA [Candidatus Azambacteria bacterium GW2011_GWE1_42_9]|nr:MAG: Rod shape-determining protein RodA [Candidatus Azambacteria bacterium GW2011_GWF1_41_10]KKS49055.1 MAG: Rod shape-determining protein RodA [Candidatus Azambacteria bacterium GW2011_GWF2_42_22]KKS79645.1 MAG: Rod shape-determining protein RodA [Candidatus Azambacteria bacterium GW2011_GWE1_42_9]KKT03036.1 MAG: Rod shape-determining protein RodA [Candidatus Azambacteria bacterium GW2011_GWD1_43_18]KKT12296.1 MAG: Rod shape-determining protein RodA [Candidatus Azambacteria bacterium GW2011